MDTELAFDSSHPIPDVTVIDVTVGLAGGGADYGLVIAKSLQSDERSLKRLEVKIQNYVGDFCSDEAARRYGTPTGPMSIVVHIHQDSDPGVCSLAALRAMGAKQEHRILIEENRNSLRES